MKPRLLDLFCGAGGAAVGYHRAGFDVVGVDQTSLLNYPYWLFREDALEFLRRYYGSFDAVHASPPCQAHTTMSNRHRGKGGAADSHVDLIASTRDALIASGLPYVLENVPGARKHLRNPIVLRGGMFGLGVDRPRCFESNVSLTAPRCEKVANPIGVYGRHYDGRRLFTRADGSIQRAAKTLEEGRAAMGIDWMTWRELTQAIPPALYRIPRPSTPRRRAAQGGRMKHDSTPASNRDHAMKRSPILRKTPLRSSGRPIKKRNAKRRVTAFTRAYGSDERVAWIKAQPCVICGATPSENMHIQGGGMGRKADADQIVPCCRYHHGRAHVKGIETFALLYKLDLPLLAAQTQAAWLVESDTPPLCVRCAASYAIDGQHCGACRFEVRRPCEPRAS